MTPEGPGRVIDAVTFRTWSVARSRLELLRTYVVELDDDGHPKRRVFGPGQLQVMATA